MKTIRSAHILADDTSAFRVVGNFLAAGPLALAHALGEAAGTFFGMGRSAEKYAIYEVNRSRFLRKADQHILAA